MAFRNLIINVLVLLLFLSYLPILQMEVRAYPHNNSQKPTSFPIEGTSLNTCVFQVHKLVANVETDSVEFTIFGGQNKIKATGDINKTWNTVSDMTIDFDSYVAAHPDVLEIQMTSDGFKYITDKEETIFNSVAHVFDHLEDDLVTCGATP